MVDVHTDRAAMFTVTPGLTQLGRGLRELGIFRTDQRRLVTDLRLAKITTLEAANGRIAPGG